WNAASASRATSSPTIGSVTALPDEIGEDQFLVRRVGALDDRGVTRISEQLLDDALLRIPDTTEHHGRGFRDAHHDLAGVELRDARLLVVREPLVELHRGEVRERPRGGDVLLHVGDTKPVVLQLVEPIAVKPTPGAVGEDFIACATSDPDRYGTDPCSRLR